MYGSNSRCVFEDGFVTACRHGHRNIILCFILKRGDTCEATSRENNDKIQIAQRPEHLQLDPRIRLGLGRESDTGSAVLVSEWQWITLSLCADLYAWNRIIRQVLCDDNQDSLLSQYTPYAETNHQHPK